VSTVELVSGYVQPSSCLTEYLDKIDKFLITRNAPTTFNLAENETACEGSMNFMRQMEDNAHLVGYLNSDKEIIYLQTFVNRGSQVVLAENIIGNALITGSANLIIFKNQKSDNPLPQKNDRKLIKLLLAGLEIVGIKLVDYIVHGQEGPVSAME